MSYDLFAKVYDNRNRDRFSRACSKVTRRYLAEADLSPPQRILDMACGTGLLVEHLHKHGHHLTGVDLSQEMLERAKQREHGPGKPPELIQHDLLTFRTEQPFDVVLCFGDVVNHFLNPQDLDGLFRSAYGNLRPGGLFLADSNSLATYRSTLWNGEGPATRQGRLKVQTRSWFDEAEGLAYLETTMSRRLQVGKEPPQVARLVERFYRDDELSERLQSAGFQDVRWEAWTPLRDLPGRGAQKTLWSARRPET